MTDNVLDDKRRPMRSSPSNQEDPRARAAAIAASIRAQRTSRYDDGIDEFSGPPAPDGWVYQWKRRSTFNKEDYSHQNTLKRDGWAEVPRSRHPEFMPLGSTSQNIENKEMVLMECPHELVEDAHIRYSRLNSVNVNQHAARIKEVPDSMLDNQTRDTARKLNRSYSAIAIPE